MNNGQFKRPISPQATSLSVGQLKDFYNSVLDSSVRTGGLEPIQITK